MSSPDFRPTCSQLWRPAATPSPCSGGPRRPIRSWSRLRVLSAPPIRARAVRWRRDTDRDIDEVRPAPARAARQKLNEPSPNKPLGGCMNGQGPIATLRIGLIGSGFIAKFHLQALVAVRHVTVTGVYSPTAANRQALAAEANALELGP